MTIERYQVDPINRRAEWLALRAGDLTASDIGAWLGVDPYRTPFGVVAQKLGIEPVIENGLMRRGRWLESAALVALAEQRPTWDIRPAGVYVRDTEVRLGATPDAIAEDPAEPGLISIQIKVLSKPSFERYWADDSAPMSYVLQTLAEGYLSNASRMLLVALVIDTYSAELAERDIPRHAEAEERIRQEAARFWQNIEAGIWPTADYERDGDTISALFPKADPVTVDLSDDNRLAEILARRAELKARMDAAKATVDAIDNEIKAKLGTAEAATLPGWRVTWMEEDRKAYEVAAWHGRRLKVYKKKDKAA